MDEKKNSKLILIISAVVLLIVVIVVVAVAFTGSNKEGGGDDTAKMTDNKGQSQSGGESTEQSTGLDIELTEAMFIKSVEYTNADKETESGYNNSVLIDLNNGSPKCVNSSVKIEGSIVTILASGKYTITGTMDEGQIVVSPAIADKDNVKILFSGVTISNSKSAPIVSKAAGKTVITLKEGTENIVNDLREANTNNETSTDGDLVETEEDNDSAIWCENDLSINGEGTLKVTANYESGIKSKDDLVVYSGKIIVDATNNAIVGNDSVAIKSGTFTLKADNNGIRCKTNDDANKGYIMIDGGNFDITVTGSAIKSEFTAIINDGNIKVEAGSDAVHGEYGVQINKGSIVASKCEEGIEGAYVVINDGEVDITASDDGINASNSIGETSDNNDNGFGMQMPEGLEKPEDGQMPEGFEKPENGQRPEGFEKPEDGQRPEGGMKPQRPGRGEKPSDSTGNGGTTVTATSNNLTATMPNDTVANAKGGMGGFGGMGVEDAYLIINGGTIKINAGGDGIDSNGSLIINGGTIYVNGPTNNGNSPIDAGKEITFNGGTSVIVGSSGMLEAPSASGKQNTIVATFNSLAANSVVVVKDEAGNEIVSYESPKAFSAFIYSSDKLEKDKTYTVSSGDTVLATLTISSTVTTSGNMMGGFGGMGGFMR